MSGLLTPESPRHSPTCYPSDPKSMYFVSKRRRILSSRSRVTGSDTGPHIPVSSPSLPSITSSPPEPGETVRGGRLREWWLSYSSSGDRSRVYQGTVWRTGLWGRVRGTSVTYVVYEPQGGLRFDRARNSEGRASGRRRSPGPLEGRKRLPG